MVFTDETSIDIAPPRSQFVRRGRGFRVLPEHTHQHRPFLHRVMLWGVYAFGRPGPLVPIQGNMTAGVYKQTLEQHLVPFMDDVFPAHDGKLQHDNAPSHSALLVRQFLEKDGNITLTWPPYSPDLAPIENLWAIVKAKLHQTELTSRETLIERVNQIWNTDVDIRASCETLITGIPRRIADCIRARGGPTKY